MDFAMRVGAPTTAHARRVVMSEGPRFLAALAKDRLSALPGSEK
jgi:hypothetical protein